VYSCKGQKIKAGRGRDRDYLIMFDVWVYLLCEMSNILDATTWVYGCDEKA